MKFYKLCSVFMAAVFSFTMITACSADIENNNGNISEVGDPDDIVVFRPVDCGIQPMDLYEFPFIGLEAKLSDSVLEKMASREIFVFSDEGYNGENAISYAVLRFSSTTEEQRTQEGMSVDILSWEASLEKIAAIGIYEKTITAELDALTGCDSHEKFGESSDGVYEYYLSTNSNGNSELSSEIKNSELFIGEMHDFDPNLGYTAFSNDRIDGLTGVGNFSTNDVFGNSYTQDIFANYDLTLVNVFTTWCSPCVKEIPELEKLRLEYEEKGIKLGVVAVVLDAKTASGLDEGAIERAQTLYERSNAKFPFLIPDDTNMNGRLTGIESVPESFFVDKNGNIVSEPYIGARSLKEWKNIVEEEFSKI